MKKKNDEMTKNLVAAFAQLQGIDEHRRFLLDLLTPTEMEELATRYKIAELLWTTDMSYADIATQLKTSTTTVTRVARFLNKEPYEGYQLVLQRLHPNKKSK